MTIAVDLECKATKNKTNQHPTYSKTCVKLTFSKITKIGFQDQFLLNAGQVEHSAILLTIKLSIGIKIFVLSFLSGRFTQLFLYFG